MNPNPANIVFAGNGGTAQQFMIDALQKPFTALTGDTFTQISPPDITQIQGQEAAGKPLWDVAVIGWGQAESYCGTLFDPLDQSLYDIKDLPPVGKCAVPAYRFANIFSYNPKDFPNAKPTSIKDFFDTKDFPGKREVYDNPQDGLLEAALIADGVAPANLYPLDVPRALKKIDTIKSSLVLSPTYTAMQNDMQSNTAAMTLLVTTTTNLVDAVTPLTPVWDFTSWDTATFGLLHNAPHEAEAQKFLAFVDEPSTQIKYAPEGGLGVAPNNIDPSTIPYTPLQRSNNPFQADRGTVLQEDNTYWDANYAANLATWTKWKVS
jgi:putative spermidine/putrescine transport system substrate-binding protein